MTDQSHTGLVPRFSDLESGVLPPLHVPPAMTIGRDRWERLVTTLDLSRPPHDVWQALTDPHRLKRWFAVCHGSLDTPGQDCTLDFEDGEFFLCRPVRVEPDRHLRYVWRWLGIGQATAVSWQLDPFQSAAAAGTRVTVIEEAVNPPWDWQTWNGGGWPGILNQLAAYLRTGTTWRWPWRRMGPYAQIELPLSLYEAWDLLFGPAGLKYWLLTMRGSLEAGASLSLMMGDASGIVDFNVRDVVQPGEMAPSFLPYVNFALKRASWGCEVPGRIWLEPAGWGRCLLQVFHTNWENLPGALQLSERRLLSAFWADAVQRAAMLCSHSSGAAATATAPHAWGAGSMPAPASEPSSASLSSAEMTAQNPGRFFGRVVGDMAGAMVGLLCLLGDRLGLFRELAKGPATGEELASRAGIHSRYAGEWLAALRRAAYLDYDQTTGRYTLPPHHAAVVADEGSPLFMGGGFQQLAGLFGPLDRLTQAFRTGDGVPQDSYPLDLREGMERMSAGWFKNLLVPVWLGALPALRTKLQRGVRVADVGCGGGRAAIEMAKAFPASRFVGYDAFAPSVARAEANAQAAGVADRVRVVHRDISTQGFAESYQFITMFNALHDISHPLAALGAVRRALDPGGTLLIVEIRTADQIQAVAGPMATVLSATGLLYNTPVAMTAGGTAVGLMQCSVETVRDLCTRAGFANVRPLPIDDPLNALYEVTV